MGPGEQWEVWLAADGPIDATLAKPAKRK